MKSIPAAAFAISLFVLSSLAFPFLTPNTHLFRSYHPYFSVSSTVFSDDFSTDTSSTFTTSGPIGSSAWSVNRAAGTDWGGRRNTSPQQLELTNDASATLNATGWVFAHTANSGFASPYSSILSANPGLVTWTFNMRQIRNDPSGFAVGSYGVAFILAGNSTDPDSGAGEQGYAVTLGLSGTTDPIRLVRFSSGLATQASMVTSNTSGLTDFGAEYLSIRVTYDPSNNTWELFLRNDGATGFSDPAQGSLASQGTTIDSTYVGSSLPITGAFWQGSSTANQTAFFDNVSVEVATPTTQPGTLSFDPSSYSPNEADGTATITVKRTGGTDGSVTVEYGATDTSTTAGATCAFASSVDYVTPSGTLTFNDGVDTQTFDLTICDDQLFEGTESLSLGLSNPTGGASIGTGTATVNILDDDAEPSLQLTASNYDVNENGGLATVTVTRTGASEHALTVNYAANVGGTATEGTCGAFSGSDFVGTSGTLSFGAGDNEESFDIAICNDGLYESSSETILIALSSQSSPALLGTPSDGTVTIIPNNDPPSVQFSSSASNISESAGTKTLTVDRTGAIENSFAIDFSTADGTAVNGMCGSGSDYVANSGTLNFTGSDSRKTFDVTICDDSLVEIAESFVASLSNPTLGAVIGGNASETVTIEDNDVSVQFGASAFAKREGSTVSVLVTRSGLTDAPATANYSVGGGNATGGTCGVAGVDFANPSGSINFGVGETSKNIDIEICSDSIGESPNENFLLSIDSATGASVGIPSTTTVTILEPLARSLWVFGGSIVPNPVSDANGRSTLIGRSFQAGVRELYVSVYQSGLNSSNRRMYEDTDMGALNSLAHGSGQEVWAAYGDADWPALTTGCPGTSFPEARMAEVAAFNASKPSNERFDGVMLDVEPSPSSEAEFRALIAHYECIRSSLPGDIKLGVAISAFWDDDIIEYPVAGSLKSVSSHIIDLPLNRVVVMGYRDSAGTDACPTSNGIICLDKDEIEYASSIGKEGLVYAGLETMPLPGEDNLTFNEEGQITMEAEASLVGTYFNSSRGLGGFAIHNYQNAYLGGAAGWPIGPSAASASISGRVTTSYGAGIRGVFITVVDSNGVSRMATSNTFGYYSIAGLDVGETYVVSANSRRYRFETMVVNLNDNADGVDLIALP